MGMMPFSYVCSALWWSPVPYIFCCRSSSNFAFAMASSIEYAIIQVMPKFDQAVNHRFIADFDETLLLPKWVPEAILIRMHNISSADVSDLTNCASLVASRMT